MTKFFFCRLAASNINKNRRTYVPFILTCILTIAMYYIMKSLSMNPGMVQMIGNDTISYTMQLGCWVVALFAIIFLFYTNSFLVKKRKKEFGVFNILGMEKRHLSRMLAWEIFYVMLISLAAGLGFGIALDKMMFLLIGKVMGLEVTLGFYISSKALGTTAALFAVIFVFILGNAVCQIHISNPIELLRAGNAGEKEPKTKWMLAILGVLCIACGYFLAITTKNPVASIFVFFVAVILVIVGTYMLFTAGSIVFLKLLRKNKGYYYKTRHFTSVSGMIYRMKQNAVGLANICVLSTMVLVMVSSTTCMMIGMDDLLKTRYPHDFSIYSQGPYEEQGEDIFEDIQKLQKERNLHVTYEQQYRYLNFEVFWDGDTLAAANEMESSLAIISSISEIMFVSLTDYNTVMGEKKTLKNGEILLYAYRMDYNDPVLKIFGKEYQIAEQLDAFIRNGSQSANMTGAFCVVVPDMDEIYEVYEAQKKAYGSIASEIREIYEFDTDAPEDEQIAFYRELPELCKKQKYNVYMEAKADTRIDFMSLYGGLFFIGIFLGVLFVMATVLIIYYKQISEGYDDKERFAIMQNVGMSHAEVKASIHSQVLIVFFLPLIVAGIHLTAAFPLISKILAVLNFVNVELYVLCTVISFLAFTAMYVLIYLMTARTYYRIVSRQGTYGD